MLKKWMVRHFVAFVMTVSAGSTSVYGQDTTLLFLDSEPGDFIGQGIQQHITTADGSFTANRNFDKGVSISFFGELQHSSPLPLWGDRPH